jgi:hypothetical protein
VQPTPTPSYYQPMHNLNKRLAWPYLNEKDEKCSLIMSKIEMDLVRIEEWIQVMDIFWSRQKGWRLVSCKIMCPIAQYLG